MQLWCLVADSVRLRTTHEVALDGVCKCIIYVCIRMYLGVSCLLSPCTIIVPVRGGVGGEGGMLVYDICTYT